MARWCIFAAGLATFIATTAAAHDFWIQPTRWGTDPPTPFTVSLLVGHGAERQRTSIQVSRIIRFESIAADGRRTDLRGRMHLKSANGDATIDLTGAGTYILALETDDGAESHLPAGRFNDYLIAEGLTPALDLRARTGRTDADGSENYSRHAKAIVQLGPVDLRGQLAVEKPIGLSLEIVPEHSPLRLPRAKFLPVRIFFRGRPLAGALVKLTNLAQDEKPVEIHRSNANGRAVFTMPGRGSWLLNVVWARPQLPGRLTDFETHFSSLSFGIAD